MESSLHFHIVYYVQVVTLECFLCLFEAVIKSYLYIDDSAKFV